MPLLSIFFCVFVYLSSVSISSLCPPPPVVAKRLSLAAFWQRMHAHAAQHADFFARAQLWFAYASYLNIVFLIEGLVHVFAFLTALSEMGQKGTCERAGRYFAFINSWPSNKFFCVSVFCCRYFSVLFAMRICTLFCLSSTKMIDT